MSILRISMPMRFPFRLKMVFLITMIIIGGCSSVQKIPSERTGVRVNDNLSRQVSAYCKRNFGPRVAHIAKTSGYVDLRTDHGCSHQCLREFLVTGVDFVEAEVSTESAGIELDIVFPNKPGKFRFFVTDVGDQSCNDFQTTAGGSYPAWLGGQLPQNKCIGFESIGSFTAKYQVEREFIGDVRGPVFMRSTKIRNRLTNQVTAENVDIEFLFGEIDTEVELFTPLAGLRCQSQYEFEFLKSAIKPARL